jgi:hypothetical protein
MKDIVAMKKLKESLTTQAETLLAKHASEAEKLAGQMRLGLAITCLIGAVWCWQKVPSAAPLYLIYAAVWLVAMLAGKLRAQRGASGLNTLIDITLVHLGLLAFIVKGYFPWLGGGIALFYFPILLAAASQYRAWLIVKAGAYATLGCLALMLYAGSPPGFKVAVLALTTFAGFTAAFKPKSLLTTFAHQAAEQGYALAAQQKEAELTAQVHQLFMSKPIVELPMVWCSSKHGAGTETVGDYYQIFETARGPLIIVGDLPGRHIEALSGIALLHQQLLQIVGRETELPKIATELNQYLFEKYQGRRPFTCVLATWEGEQMRYVNAGHLPIIQLNRQHEPTQLPVNNDAALGVKPDATFTESSVPFPARDLALLYTDGLYAKVTDNREEGSAEVERLAAQFGSAEVTTLCHRIFDCAQPGYDSLKDDATMVVIRRQPGAVAAAAESKAG